MLTRTLHPRAKSTARSTARSIAAAVAVMAPVVVAGPVGAAAPDTTAVVFVGDSITELCTSTFNSFRDDTLAALANDGYLVDAVGTRTGSNCYPGDDEHEGRAGDTAGDALARIQASGITGSPEVAFVLLGTNDVQDNVATATTVSNLQATFAELRAEVATIHIVVAQIPPYPGKAAQTSALNAAIAGLATAGASPVTVVDFHSGVGSAQLHTDLIHLNAAGAALLGDRASAAMAASGRLAQDADVPGAPTSVVASGGVKSITVTWDGPNDPGGSAITEYQVAVTGPGLTPKSVSVAASANRQVTITGLDIGAYTASVRAKNGDGVGGAGMSAPATTRRAFGPFDDEIGFVGQQYADFLGRSADASGATYWAGLTADDQSNVASIIQAFMDSPEFAPRRSVARLYQAFFERAPDMEGFDYWSTSIAKGRANLDTVSQQFVTSSEFDATYGDLSDTEFVNVVYSNVLGRTPDQNGYDFWVGRMQAGMTRGQVMTRFSESPEYVAVTRADVDVIVTYAGMLDRRPDDAGGDYWANRIAGDPNSLTVLINGFYRSAEYANRVTP